ncbi:MFS transporter [Mesorhizobium sp. M9A.F.Ca.ET.002.03.1.2]|uniref:MFS transporter n=1 Tax=Mesorhizobium sp. M9A.F.Ca.ET.002.03.1.2 TaxID=2493668 RepID=UPI000F7584F5|nr:MFS transporter [Mesorhizobium sp. M9A.F.Ca.ET.002.03.1.2]AZN99057.1 MFS transporter [Mesorhizobium sp. M9A.F.Ca.ET.002.03.1.2]
MLQTKSGSSQLLPWLVVAFGFLALALAFSARATLGLVMPVWTQEFGWSRSFISGAAAVSLLVMAATAPVAGRLIDRQGVRVTLVAGLALLCGGCLIVAATGNSMVFLIGYSGISALGFGIVATHVVSTAIARLFDRNRGLATGIATSGATGGQFLIVPVIAIVLTAFSWRWSFLAIGIACLALIPFLWRTLAAVEHGSNAPTGHASSSSLSADIYSIARKPAFHVLFWSFLLCGYTTSGVIETHFLPYASFCGFGPIPSAAAYGTLSAVNMLGMIGAGWLADRMNRVVLLGSIYLVRGLTFIILMNIGADYEMLVVFAVLFGAVDYATVPVTASLVASHLGVRVMGLAMGLISAGHSIGAAAGAFLGGYLFDLTLQYEWVWLSSLALAVGAGLMVFLLRDQPERLPAAI